MSHLSQRAPEAGAGQSSSDQQAQRRPRANGRRTATHA
jgi:hypothetical protein